MIFFHNNFRSFFLLYCLFTACVRRLHFLIIDWNKFELNLFAHMVRAKVFGTEYQKYKVLSDQFIFQWQYKAENAKIKIFQTRHGQRKIVSVIYIPSNAVHLYKQWSLFRQTIHSRLYLVTSYFRLLHCTNAAKMITCACVTLHLLLFSLWITGLGLSTLKTHILDNVKSWMLFRLRTLIDLRLNYSNCVIRTILIQTGTRWRINKWEYDVIFLTESMHLSKIWVSL